MKLKYAGISPYARKALVVMHEAGIADRIRLDVVNMREEPQSILPYNPLAKVPALVLDDGTAIFDSPVICEYLDAEFGGRRLLPASGPERWRALTRQALADGILDAALLVRQERLRPAELQSKAFIAQQLGKVYAGLDRLEEEAPGFGALDLGLVAAGCACGYLPLRLREIAEQRARWPRLHAWFDEISKRPSFAKTVPVL
ncbi:MAG: glutathione S-transferase N-terminal domain-containing protein [Burkholderiales bacterium]